MNDIISAVRSLSRPRLLIRAARYGQQDYCRDRTLSRLIGAAPGTKPLEALPKLVEVEADMERARKNDDGSYSVARHVDLLIALIAEFRLLPKGPQPTDIN